MVNPGNETDGHDGSRRGPGDASAQRPPDVPPGTSTVAVPPAAVVRAADKARDPRMMGIVLSRMFEDDVQAQTIGRYTLLGRLGAGGMGVVYAAYDDQLDRKIAVKVLRAWVAGADSRGRSRLLHEARAMARLSHPNIVTVHEVGAVDDDLFVAMEYVRGQSLDRWLEGPDDGAQARPWRSVVEVLAGAGAGLVAAHRAGIVHRDFKPHNAILDDQGVVKVLDFGLARVLGTLADEGGTPPEPADPSVVTPAGAVVGTPAYLAPEQYRGVPADERSDQFSFFASLYHALYRQLPFSMESSVALADDALHGRVRPPPPESSVPRWLHRAVLVGLRPDPTQRYPSMAAALSAITTDPSARRRRWLSRGVFAVVVAGGSAAAVVGLESSPQVSCAQGATAIGKVWGPRARAEVEQGLTASGLPFAHETWERLGPRLDAYAQAWAAARDDACADHRDGNQSAALYDARVACLQRRSTALQAHLELLSQAERATAERALSAAAALPAPAACADVTALLAAVPPPDDPVLAAQVEVQRRQLVRVREHEALGHYAVGIEQARAVVEVARRTEYRPLLAEAMVRLGSLGMEDGPPAEAERVLSEALTHALASAHFDAAAEATAQRIFVRAERLRTPKRAADDVALGSGLVQRLSADDPIRGLYLNNVGAYHIRREDYDAAREVLTRALQTKRQILGADDPDLALTLGNLAIVEQETGRDDQARAYLDEALALAERVLGPHHPMTAELARIRGELLFHTGHLPAARTALLAVLDTLDETAGSGSPLRHAPLTMLGEIALAHRRYADALEWFRRAAALGLSNDGGGAMYRVLEEAGIARAQLGLGDVESGLTTFERAVERAEREQAPYEAMLRELLGRTLLLHGRAREARAELERGLRLEQAGAGSPSISVASTLEAKGDALRQLGRLDLAEACLAEASMVLERVGGPHRPERAAVDVQRALVAEAQGRRGDAVAHARTAVNALEPWGQPDHPDRIRAQATLARVLGSAAATPDECNEAAVLAESARVEYRAGGAAFADELALLELPCSRALIKTGGGHQLKGGR